MVDVVDSKSTVASPSAACGGCSEGAASAAVGERRGRSRQGAHRAPQTLATYRRPWAATLQKVAGGDGQQEKHTCRCDGMVDVVDSKSTAGDSVPVRVRPPAPYRVFITDLTVTDTRFFFSFSGIAPSQSDARYGIGHYGIGQPRSVLWDPIKTFLQFIK